MKHKTQPTVENSITDGVKIVGYAVNDAGKYELVSSLGWQPVNIVNRQAWRAIERQIESAKKRVNSGKVSLLYYYMIANQMNIGLLAEYTKQSRLRVRLHLIPFFFKRLHPDTLENYAELFQISQDDLKNGRLKPPVYDSMQQVQQAHD